MTFVKTQSCSMSKKINSFPQLPANPIHCIVLLFIFICHLLQSTSAYYSYSVSAMKQAILWALSIVLSKNRFGTDELLLDDMLIMWSSCKRGSCHFLCKNLTNGWRNLKFLVLLVMLNVYKKASITLN